ncbi:fungal-specific transcription factor domain-containing protein [Hypomontagnella monticulosa]|nr:fungal-specific transcription factor domain-containing protein [Hypomontagnella monticulosa]
MFTTFVGTPQSLTGSKKGPKGGNTGGTLVSPPSKSADNSIRGPPRPKRQQVARACDWCRLHRVKCDNNLPCNNCQNRGWQCSNKSSNEARTLLYAYREIDRLKQRVKELEEQLKEERNASDARMQNTAASILSPSSTKGVSSPIESIPNRDQAGTMSVSDGVHASSVHSRQKTRHSPSSLCYFIGRMNNYLTSVFQQLHLDNHFQINSVDKSHPSPDCKNPASSHDSPAQTSSKTAPRNEFLTPTQEEYFLNLFWQSYHSTLIVLNEVEFKEHCRSLWATPGKSRKPSALVDIVIAMSMQYGMASIPRNGPRASLGSNSDIGDPTIAGRCYYRRCQSLLTNELENPTISTLQCQILSAIYLYCASFQNMAHGTLALAGRTAHVLGLHLEPAGSLPNAEKEMRKRLYWSLYAVESKTCMMLGRPFLMSLSSTSCTLPSDDYSVAIQAGSDFAPLDENVTWLSYNLHNVRLVLAARAVHTALYDRYSEVCDDQLIGEKTKTLERHADFLTLSIKALDTWVQAVPFQLKTKRKGNGVPFSTDHSPLAIEQFAPLWLQRQRLLLELLYHNLAMNLYRDFITFPSTNTPSPSSPSQPSSTSSSQSHAISAANHGMAVTHIMYQIMSETDILSGWYEAFEWQWNAALTLAGYLFAYPSSSTATDVRQALNHALAVFEMFGCSFVVANNAATVVRDLAAKADFLASKPSETHSHHTDTQMLHNTVPSYLAAGIEMVDNDGDRMPTDHESAVTMHGILGMDMVFSVDSSNDLEMSWPTMSTLPDIWGYNFATC